MRFCVGRGVATDHGTRTRDKCQMYHQRQCEALRLVSDDSPAATRAVRVRRIPCRRRRTAAITEHAALVVGKKCLAHRLVVGIALSSGPCRRQATRAHRAMRTRAAPPRAAAAVRDRHGPRLSAAARSPAVSASVPSRSNSTARTGKGIGLRITTERGDVVDRSVGLRAGRRGSAGCRSCR